MHKKILFDKNFEFLTKNDLYDMYGMKQECKFF